MATKRRNMSKLKSKSLSKSKKVYSSRKHLITFRKSGTKTRKMRGGGSEVSKYVEPVLTEIKSANLTDKTGIIFNIIENISQFILQSLSYII